MGKMKDDIQENNPLLQVYMKILPLVLAAVVVIFILVKVISGLIAPDQLILHAAYEDFETGAVMMTPIRVAKDAAFEKEIKQTAERKSGFTELLVILEGGEVEEEEPGIVSEDGSYTFEFENTKVPDTIYVKSPEWWLPIQTTGELELPLEAGAKTNGSESAKASAYGDAVFEITEVETTKITTGIFNITVKMTANGDMAPSSVKLTMGEDVFEEWDGSTELSYDEETGFAERTLVFRYNRSLKEDISDLMEEAVLNVEEVTVRRVYEDSEITSNMEGVDIVKVQ